MIKHAIAAMKKAQDIEVNEKNLDICIVGLNTEFKKLSENEIKGFLSGSGMVIDQ